MSKMNARFKKLHEKKMQENIMLVTFMTLLMKYVICDSDLKIMDENYNKIYMKIL